MRSIQPSQFKEDIQTQHTGESTAMNTKSKLSTVRDCLTPSLEILFELVEMGSPTQSRKRLQLRHNSNRAIFPTDGDHPSVTRRGDCENAHPIGAMEDVKEKKTGAGILSLRCSPDALRGVIINNQGPSPPREPQTGFKQSCPTEKTQTANLFPCQSNAVDRRLSKRKRERSTWTVRCVRVRNFVADGKMVHESRWIFEALKESAVPTAISQQLQAHDKKAVQL
jgi:hypothetical protein